MSDPRWTIDRWNVLVWDGTREDDSQWFYELPDVAYLALVAAVRDADILRQARDIAQRADAAMGNYEEDKADDLNDALYKLLLSSPVSPDTPTPTGQT